MKLQKLSLIVSAALLSSACVLNATTLKEAVDNTIKNNPELKSIIHKNKAYRLYVDEAKGNYLPSIDLEVTGESRRTESKQSGLPKITENQGGADAKITIDQLIYDGGYTPARVEEAEFTSKINELTNKVEAEGIIYDTVKSYLDLVKYEERLRLSTINVKTHEEYMKTAKSNEEITGNSLDTFEVKSKLHLAKKNVIEEIDNKQIAYNSFKRLTGTEIKDGVCAPNIDNNAFPNSLKKLTDYAITNNSNVLAQVAKISEQRAIINQEKSKYLPTLRLNLEGTWDDDLITADVKQNIYSAKLILNYNLYNGGKDSTSNLREKIFLNESQEILNSKTDLVVDEVTSAYYTFKNTKDKIVELKEYVLANENILSIYKDQFEGGTRTFVDVLDVEADLYNARVQLVDEQIKLIDTYYTILKNTSQIEDSIMNQANEQCVEVKTEMKKEEPKQNNLEELSSVLNIDTPSVKEEKTTVVVDSNLVELLKSEFSTEIENKTLEFDESDMSFRMLSPESSMPIGKDGMLVFTDSYKSQVDKFVSKLLKVIESNKNKISEVQLNGYSSTNFVKAKNEKESYAKNLVLSKKRANKVLNHITKVNDGSKNIEIFKAYGKSYDNPVLDKDGKEDLNMSKRVEFTIKTK